MDASCDMENVLSPIKKMSQRLLADFEGSFTNYCVHYSLFVKTLEEKYQVINAMYRNV